VKKYAQNDKFSLSAWKKTIKDGEFLRGANKAEKVG
jgi:hypothetical protein